MTRHVRVATAPSATAVGAAPASPAAGGGGQYSATLTVAAPDALDSSRDRADFLCTGVDDHLTIIEALEACDDLGFGRVLLSEGRFIMGQSGIYGDSGSLSNVTLQGQNMDATILEHHWGSVNQYSLLNYGSGFHVLDLTFDANDILDGGYGVQINGDDSSVERVRFRFMGAQSSSNLSMTGARALVDRCKFENTGREGAGALDISGASSMVLNNRFLNINDRAIIAGTKAIVTGNVVRFDNSDESSTNSITVDSDSVVVGNICEGDSATATISYGAGSVEANNVLL